MSTAGARRLAAVIAAACCFAGAVLLYRAGISANPFGPFTQGGGDVLVYRHSGPWIAGAFGVALVGLLLVVPVAAEGYRAVRARRMAR